MSIADLHAEWLSLIDVSGPFLSVSVLKDVFPNGLVTHDAAIAAEFRKVYDAWSDPEDAGLEDSEALQRAFLNFVLERVLGFRDGDLVRDPSRLKSFSATEEAHGTVLEPTAVLVSGERPVMLVSAWPRAVSVDQPVPGDAWSASPRERMVEMLRETGCPLGLVTDGERWTVVSRREGEPPGYATWWASLWREERITFQAFRTLLRAEQFFSVPQEETLTGLLERSAQDQSEVTTKLGNQTLEAVEILIRTIDRLDQDRGGKLLADVPENELYDAAVTVMMRLIFLFFAEENELLPMEEPLYVREYAASTLRTRLQESADQYGQATLTHTSDAWPRLLATWRAVYAGIEHEGMRLSPYGGSLFDPDRFPFLEGRLPGSSWREEPADPLPIDNRTVLHLLTALQTLREGGQHRRLSFRALDVEQIGHVYEGMLDHTAARADGWVLGLSGTGGKEPEIALEELEALDDDELVDLLKDRTGRNAQTLGSWLDSDPNDDIERRFAYRWNAAFGGDAEVARRARRFAKFMREDSTRAPTAFQPGSVYVCDSSHRGATGTHYTPRSFTEEIVRETLDPLVYDGMAEGKPEGEWKLRRPEEILELKVADPACGSGAFLVQACRYLSAKLVESKRLHGELDRDPTDEDLVEARRVVAGRCLYGVDSNPMAVEMAKLSMWLVTLDRNKPFSFVDHALRVGDSLFGMSDLDQLRTWSLSGAGETEGLFEGLISDELDEALSMRLELESFPVLDSVDAERKAELLRRSDGGTKRLRALADLLFAPSLASEKQREIDELRDAALHFATHHLDAHSQLRRRAREMMGDLRQFHWPLEFPEVFRRGGFAGVIGNPPFLGGKRLRSQVGSAYREYLVRSVAGDARGSADLVAYFFRRCFPLARRSGNLGLIAVNTIAEGDSRRVGLEPLLRDGGDIYSARSAEPWPNVAAVVTSRVHLHKGKWRGRKRLDGRPVDHVSAFLSEQVEWSPTRLIGSGGLAFIGSILSGSGFILDPGEAQELVRRDARNADVVFPYVNGRDLNQDPEQKASRWVICFWDWPLTRARRLEEPFRIVKERVKPHRDQVRRKTYRENWWRFAESVPGLYHAIGRGHAFEQHPGEWRPDTQPLPQVVVVTQVGKFLAVSRVPNDQIFPSMVVVFASDSAAFLALLLSCVHSEWAWKQSSKLKRDLRYTPSDCFETFPLPVHGKLPDDPVLDDLGERFHDLRREVMKREQVGLTTLYNRFHDPSDPTEDLDRLRALQVAIDRRVLELYDWQDIEIDHDFREVPYLPDNDRLRYAISEEARLEILDRLGRLNRERYEEEVEAGLHGKKKAGNKKKAASASGDKRSKTSKSAGTSSQGGLFEDVEGDT